MDARDLLLDEHARMHAVSVTGEKGTLADRTFGGLSDDQMRARPREDLNSLAWLMWHIARAEDIFANIILSGREQIVDDGWLPRLKISRRDFGIGMSKPEVAELTTQVDVAALRDYRDAVGRRTAARASASWAACSSPTPPCTWARPRRYGRRAASAPESSCARLRRLRVGRRGRDA